MTGIVAITPPKIEVEPDARGDEGKSISASKHKNKSLENESQLIEHARQGNDKAFAMLLKHYDKQVMNVILRFTANQFDRDDLYQDIMTACYQALPRFTGHSKFYTWLYRIALNHCISHLRNKTHSPSYQDEAVAPNVSWEQHKQIEAINNALKKLAGAQHISFHLFYIEQWSVGEIAQVLECSTGTVKSNLDRARKKIRLDEEVKKWNN